MHGRRRIWLAELRRGRGVLFQNGKRHYYRVAAESISVAGWAGGDSTSCCWVNLAVQGVLRVWLLLRVVAEVSVAVSSRWPSSDGSRDQCRVGGDDLPGSLYGEGADTREAKIAIGGVSVISAGDLHPD